MRARLSNAELTVVLTVAAIPRLWAAVADQGIVWPDEIHQSLEPAHRWAFGYGLSSWEFKNGGRSWLLPGLFGLWFKLLALSGVHSAEVLVVSAKLLMAFASVVTVWLTMRLAESVAAIRPRHGSAKGPDGECRRDPERAAQAAFVAGVLAATLPASVCFGARCMSEMASAPLVTLACLLVVTAEGDRARMAAAGALASLAIFVRYQNGIVATGLFVLLLSARRFRDALPYAVAGVVVAALGGLLDRLTWGGWFHSFFTYVRFNLIEGRASEFGTSPFDYYVDVAWTSSGPAVLFVVLGLVMAGRGAPQLPLALVGLAYIALHSAIAHKEFRFIQPVVPVLLAVAAVGLVEVTARAWALFRPASKPNKRRHKAEGVARAAPARVVWGAACGIGAAFLWQTTQLTFGDMGQRSSKTARDWSPWHNDEGTNRLLWRAGEQSDVCGLVLVNRPAYWTGGYTYFHKDVPIFGVTLDTAAPEEVLSYASRFANYLIVDKVLAPPPGFDRVEESGNEALVRRKGDCDPPPPGDNPLARR